MNWFLLLRLLHLLGAFGFVAAHGATAAVTFKLRSETDPVRVRAMLDLSRATRGVMYVSFLVLLGAGVALGFAGAWWWAGWIWTSLGIFAVLFLAAFPLAVPYFRALRRTLEPGAEQPEEMRRLLRSSRPLVLAWFETLGIVLIIVLMVYKPF
jgi:hypothetical protein